MTFKVGDRVRTTEFPGGVTTERGHRVGDVGTIVGDREWDEQFIVQFDRQQGIEHSDSNNVVHDHAWVCRGAILEYAVDPTPEQIEAAIADLDVLLNGKKDAVREDGTFVSAPGAKAIIHVHQQKIKKGEPAVILRRRGKSRHFTKVEILGPSTMVHSQIPDSCGARVWIETKAEVIGHE